MKLRQPICLVHWWLGEAPSLSWIPGMKMKKIRGQLYLFPSPFKHTEFFFFLIWRLKSPGLLTDFRSSNRSQKPNQKLWKESLKKKKKKERMGNGSGYNLGHLAPFTQDLATARPPVRTGELKKVSKNSSPWLLLYHRWGIWRVRVKRLTFSTPFYQRGENAVNSGLKSWFWVFF